MSNCLMKKWTLMDTCGYFYPFTPNNTRLVLCNKDYTECSLRVQVLTTAPHTSWYGLVLHKPENEHLALAEITDSVHRLMSKTWGRYKSQTGSTPIADLNKNNTFSRTRHTTIGAILIQISDPSWSGPTFVPASKRMYGSLSSSAYFTHSIRFVGSGKVGLHCFQKFCYSFDWEGRKDSVGKSRCKHCTCSFSATLLILMKTNML